MLTTRNIQAKTTSDTPDIRIFIIGVQDLFVAGLRSLIQGEPGLTVVGESARWVEDLNLESQKPDVILLKPGSGEEDTLDSLPDLIQAADRARILLLVDIINKDVLRRALNLGAKGVVGKLELPGSFFEAIRRVHRGEPWINRSLMAVTIQQKADSDMTKIASLTKRELEVIGLLCDGLRNKQIAGRLFLAECTVRHHLSSIFDKLELTDRLELIIYAHEHGLASLRRRQRSDELIERVG